MHHHEIFLGHITRIILLKDESRINLSIYLYLTIYKRKKNLVIVLFLGCHVEVFSSLLFFYYYFHSFYLSNVFFF